jgi:2-dehydro-3-deoxyglucarate aldolase
VSIGSWVSIAHPVVADILAHAGYDWVAIDAEHTAIDLAEILTSMMGIEGRGSVPLVRLSQNDDPAQVKAVMDAGAAGVIVPMVNSKADAERAVSNVKYPPEGTRGVGLSRAQGYGADFEQYVERANVDGLLMVQIEHINAVERIAEILSVPGIDGTFVGPYDLSASMGLSGQLDHADVLAAQQHVLDIAIERGVAPGIHLVQPDDAEENLRRASAAGYKFIALGVDMLFLGDSARQLHAAARLMLDDDG